MPPIGVALLPPLTCAGGSANGDGSITGGGTIGGGVGVGTIAAPGPFLDGESHVPMSMLCLPGTIGGGAIPFFFTVVLVVFTCGLAGCDAIDAQVIFLGASFCCW